MRKWLIMIIDLMIVAVAIVAAMYLRDDMEFSVDHLFKLQPYVVISMVLTLLIGLVGKMNRGMWRYSSFPDYLRITGLTTLIVITAVAISFALNRMENIARALPIIQWGLMTSMLISVRLLRRALFKHQGFARSEPRR